MSGRHQNTTFRALDLDRLAAYRDARSNVEALSSLLARTPRSEEEDVERSAGHAEEVWQRDLFDALRPILLRRFLRLAPARWAPLLAESICNAVEREDEHFVESTFYQLSARFELYSVPDAYGLMVYASPAYAARFGCTTSELEGAAALRDALGGEPDPQEEDLRFALRDAVLSQERVQAIAQALTVPQSLPAFTGTLPHAVEQFDVDPVYLADILRELRAFYCRAAEERLPVQVLWHANP